VRHQSDVTKASRPSWQTVQGGLHLHHQAERGAARRAVGRHRLGRW